MRPDPKPYAQSCDENRDPIRAVLAPLLTECRHLLEVGSGTGQHAVYFAAQLPHLTWQTSDLPENLPGIRLWLAEAALPNLPPPLPLAVTESWPEGPYDAAFSANTAHIVGEPEITALFAGIGRVLIPNAPFVLYGPFNYGGRYTSPSNARFDAWLKQRDPRSGIKDRDALVALADANDMTLRDDHPMPCNNRLLVFRRRTWDSGLG